MILAWIPSYEGHQDNEKVEELAQDSDKAMPDPEPFCIVPKVLCKVLIKQWMQKKFQEW